MASIAMDEVGNIAMGYSVSDGSSTYPGIRYCGHTSSAPAGVMGVQESVIWDGSYSQTTSERWGDYSNMSVDPTDGRTFWFTSQYKQSSTHTKGTRIAAFSLGIQVALDQQRQDGTRLSGTMIGRWNGSSFDNIVIPPLPNPPPTISTAVGMREVLRGYQQIVPGSSEKYFVWERNFVAQLDTVQNHRGFTIQDDDAIFISRFNYTHSAITIKNSLEMSSINSNDSIYFKDPWLIDYSDPLYGNSLRNRGMDAPFKKRPSPFYPDYTTSYNGDVYKGVFLNQGEDWLPPYYSVKADYVQDIYLQQTCRTHTFYFQGWSATPEGSATFQNASALETPVVFNQPNATVQTNLEL